MVHQTSRVNGSASSVNRVGPVEGVTRGASSVIHDALDLVELQAKLLKADAEECSQAAKTAVVGMLVSVCLLLASLPVLAFGCSSLLFWLLEWPLWVCQMLVGGGFALAGVGLGFWCVQRLRSSLGSFSASQREMAENFRWLRQAVSKSFSGI